MLQAAHTTVLLAILAVSLAACGSSSGNQRPTAVITTAATENVPLNAVVFVDGSESSDPEGAAVSYAWSLIEQPPGGAAQMADPTLERASFTATLAGDYAVQLVVNDGVQDSEPVTTMITVVRPAPTVTISSPEENQVFTSNAVAVTGTVDDPSAAITVNGNPVTNAAGNYTTNLTPGEGAHRIKVVATNASGEGSADVTAVVNTADNPVVWIASPRQNFIAGPTLDASPTSDMTTVNVAGFVKVNTFKIGLPDPNLPTVSINGQPATFVDRAGFLGCSLTTGGISFDLCYRFAGAITVKLSQELSISVVATDALSRTGSAGVDGYVDYCIKGGFDGLAHYQADAGGRQNNRCHEIDGCSLYAGEDDQVTQIFRNNPAAALGAPQLFNSGSTAFGSGDAPPQEFYIHGNRPAQALPCNEHDQCYQTAGTAQSRCDFQKMYVGTHDVCRKAYPATCPFTGVEAANCPKWLSEKAACYDAADLYYLGDVKGGAGAHSSRQREYTYPLK
jgi:hypothetical protein